MAKASRSTPTRNACGVCARKISSRGSVPRMMPAASPRFTVSRARSAAIAAPCFTAASIVRSINDGVTSGRAAS